MSRCLYFGVVWLSLDRCSYRCLSNKKRRTLVIAKLVIESNPIQFPNADLPLVSTHHHVNTQLGNNAELHCNYFSAVDTQIEWQRDDGRALALSDASKYKLITNADADLADKQDYHKTQLQVRNVQAGDLGAYRCVVRNQAGSGHAIARLQLEPEPPRFEGAQRKGAETVTNWQVRSHQALIEVALSYKLNGTTAWKAKESVRHEKSKEHSGLWK